jgi:hypothetical protein
MRIDDDDDDDDLVLFKEQQVPLNHFSLSQSSVHNSQSQEASPIKARTNCIISRQERRKRRHEWRERQLVEQELSPEEATPESEDAFASLQSLLEPSQDIPQPSQPQEAEKENIRQDTEMNDCDMDPKTAEEETQRKEKEIGKVDDQILQVTSNKHIQTVLVQDQRMTYQNNEETETIDFDTFRDDHDDDDDDDEILPPSQQRKSPEPAKSRFPSRGFDARNESCSPTRRSKKPRHNLDKLRQMIQGKSSQNRPLSSKQQTSRRPFPFQEPEADTGRLSNPWNRKTQSQIQAIETQNAKSIVGSRYVEYYVVSVSMPFHRLIILYPCYVALTTGIGTRSEACHFYKANDARDSFRNVTCLLYRYPRQEWPCNPQQGLERRIPIPPRD